MHFSFPYLNPGTSTRLLIDLVVHGKSPEEGGGGILLTLNTCDRLGHLRDGQLVLSQPVSVAALDGHTIVVIDELALPALPESLQRELELVCQASDEVRFGSCDICGRIAHVDELSVQPLCACTTCTSRLTRKFQLPEFPDTQF